MTFFDKQNQNIRTLNNVLSEEVSMNSLATIKRTARFHLKDDCEINYLNDRIQPIVENYDEIISILACSGITKYNIEYTDAVLTRSVEFEAGIEKLLPINNLLKQINYTPIYDDAHGVFASILYRSQSIRSADYVYADDNLSVIPQGVEEELDLFNIPNRWVVLCSNPEKELLIIEN